MTMRGTAGYELPILWYENDTGARHVPDFGLDECPRPPGGEFKYQHSRFPCSLQESICTDEGLIGSGSSSWPGALVLAMTRPSLRELFWQIVRHGWLAPRLALPQAILRAAGCERCINVLAHRYGLGWGYREHSDEALRSGTSCDGCYGGTQVTR